MLRIATRDFSSALDRPGVALAGKHCELWAARATGWVSSRELAQLDRLLHQISTRLRHPRSRTRTKLVSLCFVLAPLPSRPKRRT